MTKKNIIAPITVGSINGVRQQRFAYASSHAAKRIAQRTSMNILELMILLDSGVYVNIGQAAGSHCRHLLFFSPIDKFYYVAIQDARYGKIITVLPPAYHKNLAWRISPEQCQLAKQRYLAHIESVAAEKSIKNTVKMPELLNEDQDKRKSIKYRTITTTKRTYKIMVQALYISEFSTTKRRDLFKTSIDYYIDGFEKSIKELLGNAVIHAQIDSSIQKKRLCQDSIYALCFQERKDRLIYHILPLRSQHEAELGAQRNQQQHEQMQQILSLYISPDLTLPMPTSMQLLRLCWKQS